MNFRLTYIIYDYVCSFDTGSKTVEHQWHDILGLHTVNNCILDSSYFECPTSVITLKRVLKNYTLSVAVIFHMLHVCTLYVDTSIP